MAYQIIDKFHLVEGTSIYGYEALSVSNYARHGLIPYYSGGCTCNPNSSGAGSYGLMQLVYDTATNAYSISPEVHYSVVCDGTNEKNEVKRILTKYNTYSNWETTYSERIVLRSEDQSSNIKRYLCSGAMPYKMSYYFGVNRCDNHVYYPSHFVNPFYYTFNDPYASVTLLQNNMLNIYNGEVYGKYALTSCIFGGLHLVAYGSSHPAKPNAFSWDSALYADTPNKSKYIYTAIDKRELYVAGYYPRSGLTVDNYAHGCVFGTIVSPVNIDKSKLSIPVSNTSYSITSSNIKYLGQVTSYDSNFANMIRNSGLFEEWDTTLKYVYIFYKDMYNVANIPPKLCTISGVKKSS